MKVLQITFRLSSGGGERFVVDLSNEISRKERVVLLQIISNENINNAHYLPDLSSRVKYINLGFKQGASLGVMMKILHVLKKEKPDVVHVHCALMPVALAVFLYRKPCYFHTLHSLAERCLGPLWRKPLYRFLYKNYVNAITISELCRESFEKLYSIKKPLMIYNGRSPIEETEKCNEVRKEINSLKLHPDDKVFIHVARFHPVKNHTLLFHTFKKLIDEGEHIILLIIGNGYDGHIFFKKNNSKGVYLLGEKRNVGDYLCCSDCFVMSSLKEGLPISLIEAMSMGIIPVSTPAGGVCDVIRNHENGYLSPTHTFEDFYKTVKESIINVAGIMPEKLIKEYLEKYSMNRCSCDYLNAYRVEYVKRKRRPKS